MTDLSIIIVSWNAKNHLMQCLQSIFESNIGLDYEIIVVDNASEDGSPQAVQTRYPSVLLIQNTANLGFSKANNIGISRAQGKYIALVNSDVKVFPACFSKLHYFMETNPLAGLCGPKVLNSNGTLQPSVMYFPSIQMSLVHAFALHRAFPNSRYTSNLFDTRSNYNELRHVEALSGCFWFVRGKLLKQIGGLDERFFMYGEDIDFCKRIQYTGYKIVFNPNAKIIHFGGASSNNAPLRFFIELHKANLLYWNKHYGFWGREFIRLMIVAGQTLRLIPRVVNYLLYPSLRKISGYNVQRSLMCIQYFLLHYNVTPKKSR